MRCPKCKTINRNGATECDGCGVVFADIRKENKAAAVSTNCCWNDHGYVCLHRGVFSNGTNGSGSWYCAEHWAKLKNFPEQHGEAESISFRHRWFMERGLPYKHPILGDRDTFRCIGREAKIIAQSVREPGEDAEEMDHAD